MFNGVNLASFNILKQCKKKKKKKSNRKINYTLTSFRYKSEKQIFYHSAGIWYNLLRGLSKVAVILNVSLVLSCCASTGTLLQCVNSLIAPLFFFKNNRPNKSSIIKA